MTIRLTRPFAANSRRRGDSVRIRGAVISLSMEGAEQVAYVDTQGEARALVVGHGFTIDKDTIPAPPETPAPQAVDLSILDGNAKNAIEAIESGGFDADSTAALVAAERAGKGRKTVLRALGESV